MNDYIANDEVVNTRSTYIVGIPDYLLSTLASRGIDNNTLFSKIDDNLKQNNGDVWKLLEDNLSKYDLVDFYTFNKMLDDTLEIPTVVLGNADVEARTRIINHYRDMSTDLSQFIMNNKDGSNAPFRIECSGNCLFIIPKPGFGNVFVTDTLNFKIQMLNYLTIIMRKSFGDELTYNGETFRRLSRLVYSK